MNILRNVLAVLVGLIAGAMLNGLIIQVSPLLIPPPAGVDISTMEGLKAGLHKFEVKHFIMPFLAHALGTLLGSLLAALISVSLRQWFALAIGLLFLVGGFASVVMLPAPLWFDVIDLALAYIPMAYLGYWLANKIVNRS